MPDRTKSRTDAELSREIQRFSMQALELAKAVVDGAATEDDKQKARELAERLPGLAAKSRELSEAYRPGAAKTLADARLDLAFVAADGKLPSSTRIGWYIKEKGVEQGH
jgi:hypothetical protein